MASLIEDVDYQYRLREDFRKRRVHPSVEALVWAYHLGKPTNHVELTANVTTNERLADERERLRQNLDVAQLEALVAESEALIRRALEAAQRTAQGASSSSQPPDAQYHAIAGPSHSGTAPSADCVRQRDEDAGK